MPDEEELSPREAAYQRRVEAVRGNRKLVDAELPDNDEAEDDPNGADFTPQDRIEVDLDREPGSEPDQEAGPEEQVEPEPEPEQDSDDDGSQAYKAKVDGVEEEFSADEIRYAAKTRAAEKRFREAAEIRQKADAEIERLKRENEQLKQRSTTSTKTDQKPIDAGQAINQLFDARLDGNQTEAERLAKELSGLVGQDNTPDLDQLVEAKLAEQEQARRKQLINLREKELDSYSSAWAESNEQIAADPILTKLVNERTTEKIFENPGRNAIEVVDEATEEVAAWVESQKSSSGNGLEERTNLKRRVGGQQRTKSAQRKGNVKRSAGEQREQSRADYIEDLRKSRQTVHV